LKQIWRPDKKGKYKNTEEKLTLGLGCILNEKK